MFMHPMPTSISILVAVMFGWHLYSTRRKKLRRPPADYDPLAERKKANLSAIEEVVSDHSDCTAEVFNIFVKGVKKVKTIRLLDPGDEVEIRKVGGDVKVYAFGEYMADLMILSSSHLMKAFDSNVKIEAFIGGRDLAYIYDNDFDICSVIVFYKLDGVPPTKVNLQ